jgi:2-polyprenyl-3-methyl-5-hydroxy-6-metoxy-1,4-benzoquinol methylase
MINTNCPVCHSTDNKILYDLRNPSAHKNVGLPGIVKKCRNCHLIFKSFENKIDSLYDDNYASTFFELKEYSGGHVVDFFKKIVKPAAKKSNTPTLLDIGSGMGVMLETAKNLGYDATGVELSKSLADDTIKRGYKVINKNVSEIPTSEKFDMITMMDIIEHLENPLGVMKTLKKLLNERGEVIVYTPNHDSLIVKISNMFYKLGVKSPIENIFACTHTCFFTTKTLKMTLEKAGYKITETRHFNYDISRPGQKVSFIAKLGINMIEKTGSLMGFNGFRVVMYAQPIN